MSHKTMLPPPPAALRRDETEHGPKAPSSYSPADASATEQAPATAAPLGASLAPVALPAGEGRAQRNTQGPPRKSRRLAVVLLPAAAAIVIGGLGFAASYSDAQPFQGAQHVFPPLGQLAEVTAAGAVTPPRAAGTAAVSAPTGPAQPSACPALTTAPACGPGRFATRIVLPEVIIRREPATPGPGDLVAP